MSIYAIADLHLAYSQNKPMDIFGDEWLGYMDKIKLNWEMIVKDNDTVLIPGDISWAMHINEALEDFMFLESMPGRKIIIKGNHDYWWDTVSKIKRFFEDNRIRSIDILHNNSYLVEDAQIFGTRGWILKNTPEFSDHDDKIYKREIERLKLSLSSMNSEVKKRIVMLHYPPISYSNKKNEFTDIMDGYGIDISIFGHIHSSNSADGYNCVIGNTEYKLVSSDHIGFKPVRILGTIA